MNIRGNMSCVKLLKLNTSGLSKENCKFILQILNHGVA